MLKPGKGFQSMVLTHSRKEAQNETADISFTAARSDDLYPVRAVIVSLFLKEVSDAVIILAVILLNAVIGMVQEVKAEKSLEALKKLSSPTALVRRSGLPVEIPAAELVVGDIVILEAGRIIPADLRLINTINMKVEESALTGESVPVQKDADFVAEGDVTLGDRLNMAYLSTSVGLWKRRRRRRENRYGNGNRKDRENDQ